ncbi:hypothetical protein [Spiroplasma endosymbiont of Labia minor]|uniref:hypothetical protein n=1 Tax=Spiroplasma endosymbiont of Labia minor TaxID=3066305 RepID=UPI0030CBE285
MKERTKINRILFTIMITLNFHLFFIIFLSSIFSFLNKFDDTSTLIKLIGIVVSLLLLIASICNIIEIKYNDINKFFIFFGYWFLPLSIPYLITSKIIDENYQQVEKNNYTFLVIISIINLVFSSIGIMVLFSMLFLKTNELDVDVDMFLFF